MANFVHLHNHSSLSLLDGAGSVESYVKRAAELNQPALAITDHGSLSGIYDLWKYGTQYGVKPVAGCEFYVAPGGRRVQEKVVWGELEGRVAPSGNGSYTHLTVLARTAEGLRNLYRLHAEAHLSGFYMKPRIDFELLDQYHNGLVVTTGCAGGELSTRLRLGHIEDANYYLASLADITRGNLYVEIMGHQLDFEDDLNRQLIDLAYAHGRPLVVTNDCHYVHPEDATTHDALLCVQTHATLQDTDRFRFNGSGYYLKSYDEMAALGFPKESLENTLLIAESVEPYDSVFHRRNMMPVFDSPYTLREAAEQGLESKGLHWELEYCDRMNYELDIIERMGYEDYFLVLADIVQFARRLGILVGPGRGSAGGSLVSYLLGITELDPLKHGLVFERFLNPSRVSPPDIDVDFQDDRRDEVVKYAVEKYGADRVAQIVTFGMIKSRAAIKDANRVLGGTYKHGEELAAMIPPDVRGRAHPLEGLTKLRQADSEVYDLALGLEGMVRSLGKHAAGLVISPEPLADNIPVQQGPRDSMLVTGYPQEVLEELGYVKQDLLGLKELSIIEHTLRMINESAEKEA